MNERLIELFNKVRNENKDMSLDDVLYKVYEEDGNVNYERVKPQKKLIK